MEAIKVKVLFVCLGNICRSPSAEAVMKKLVADRGFTSKIFIDSAGTLGYHEGEPADARMRMHGAKRGYNLTSISRPLIQNDYYEFDFIITMDDANYSETKSRMEDGKSEIIKMSKFFNGSTKYTSVPDPYYGGEKGFETVLDLLEEACENFLDYIIQKYPELKQ